MRIALAVCIAVVATSCLGGTPKQSWYTLGAAVPATRAPVASRPDLGIAVGPIEFPRYLDRPELVTRDGAHGLSLSNTHRWAGSLRNDFQRVLAEQIARELGTAQVATFPNEPRFAVDYRVQLELLAFEGPLGGPVALRARWVVADGSTGRARVVEESAIEEPCASPSHDDLVAALGRAMQRLGADIATRIASLAPAPTGG